MRYYVVAFGLYVSMYVYVCVFLCMYVPRVPQRPHLLVCVTQRYCNPHVRTPTDTAPHHNTTSASDVLTAIHTHAHERVLHLWESLVKDRVGSCVVTAHNTQHKAHTFVHVSEAKLRYIQVTYSCLLFDLHLCVVAQQHVSACTLARTSCCGIVT